MNELLEALRQKCMDILAVQNGSSSRKVKFNRVRRATSDLYEYCLVNTFTDSEAKQASEWIEELTESMRGGGWQVAKCLDVLMAFETKQ
jgi:hypothetical protein